MFPLIYKIYLAPRDKFVLFIFGPGGGWEGEVVLYSAELRSPYLGNITMNYGAGLPPPAAPRPGPRRGTSGQLGWGRWG